jgi:hypothetical protein
MAAPTTTAAAGQHCSIMMTSIVCICVAGGGLAWANDIPVTQGTNITITVGRGGTGAGSPGGPSWFRDATFLVAQGGGGGRAVPSGTTFSRLGGLGGGFSFSSAAPTSRGGSRGGDGSYQSCELYQMFGPTHPCSIRQSPSKRQD